MNSWSKGWARAAQTGCLKIVSALLLLVGFAAGQTAPAAGPSSVLPAAAGTPPATSSVPAAIPPKPAPCPAGPGWLCVAQTLQSLMFNADGTHRADPDIATDANRAIEQLIKDGVIKEKDAPAKPITGFDDANKYLAGYPTGVSASAPAAATEKPSATPPVTTQAPAKSEPCPADRPWLCETPPPAPVKAATTSPGASAKKAGTPTKTTATKASAATAAPPPATSAGVPPPYKVGANDVVQVSVFDEPKVSAAYAIGPDGRMSMPLIGNFRVVDLTLDELRDLVTQKLRDDGGILEPVVNVQLLRNNSKQYTLLGGAGHTGPVPLLRETTILDALAAAGFKEFANKKKITLRRGTKEFKFNYEQVVKGIHMEQNILIEDGDFIIVKE